MSETLEGTIERVTFSDGETGFAVVKVTVPGRASPVTLTGKFPSPAPGESVSAEGEWVTDANHGKQFKAQQVVTREPAGGAAIERFLGSGLVDGVGPGFAKKIVARFGDKTLAIIDHSSKKLEEIPGIGTKKRKEIKASWDALKTVRRTLIFLHGHGISPARAAKIYQEYGADSVRLIEKDPYALADDIRGIGFKTADSIASTLGIGGDDPRRLGAAALHALEHGALRGHCAVCEEELVAEIASLTHTDTRSFAITTTLAGLVVSETVRRERLDGRELYFLPRLFWAEYHIAVRLAALVSRAPSFPKIDAGPAIERAEASTGTTLAQSQRECVLAALAHRVLVVTGGPGVGKTTIINTILTLYRGRGVVPVLAAPTGRAARRLAQSSGIETTTVHKLLEYQPGHGFTRNRNAPLGRGDLFVLDEMSMMDAPLMAAFLEALPENAHLLLVGDVDQLPSVGAGAVLRDIIDSGTVPVARLTEVFRQAAASRIVQAAHAVNAGSLPELTDGPGSDFYFIERDSPAEITRTLLHLVTERIPEKFGLDPVLDIQVLTPMHRDPLGTAALNSQLQEALNPRRAAATGAVEPPLRGFRPGDKVLQLRNNDALGLSNGDIGTVSHTTEDPAALHVQFDAGRTASYPANALDDIVLAYATTIHKSQGSEFPCVVIPLTTAHHVMLQRNLLYTAITRGKRLVILVGSRRAFVTAVGNARSNQRTTTLATRLKLACS